MRSEQALAIIRREAPQALDDAAASTLGELVHDPATPAGGPLGHPQDDAARVEAVLDRGGR
jgi:hypothetical protein